VTAIVCRKPPPIGGFFFEKVATYLPSVVTGDGDVMADTSDLEQRIEENRQKIEEISAFRDDPKIDKIIRVLQKQIAQDFYQLSLLDQVSQHGDVPRPMYA
jgi:hypothetical protein